MALVALVAAVFDPAPPAARAEGPAPAPSRGTSPAPYQGAFLAVQAHAGLSMRLAPGDGEGPGPVVGVSGRVASVLSLADVLLGVFGARLWPVAPRPATSPSGGLTLDRLTVALEARLHPAFTELLHGTAWARWLAGLYVALGLDVDVSWLSAGGRTARAAAVGWHLGAGMSWPLTEPDDGASLWLGLAYQLGFKHTPAALTRLGGLQSLDEQAVVFTLGWRDNRISSFYLPRPDELNDRDPHPPE